VALVNSINDAISEVAKYQQNSINTRVCYTAVFGAYDELHPPCRTPNVEFICFTDQPQPATSGWNFVLIDFLFIDPRRTARLFKCLPHILFPNHESSLWMDGNWLFDSTFLEFVNKHSGDFVCFQHPVRNCLYEEGKACSKHGKDSKELIESQLTTYRDAGMPDDFGLIASCIILRRHNQIAVKTFCQEWMDQIAKFSNRDQLSFPYTAWHLGFSYELFSARLECAPGLRYMPHKRWIFYDPQGRRMWTVAGVLAGLYSKLRFLFR
jgi:hypothetical protein